MMKVTSFHFYLFMAALISLLTIITCWIYYSKYRYIINSRQKYSQFSKKYLNELSSSDEGSIPLK
eukprot:UN06851